MSRRIECAGPGDRPCPAHAWWYYGGRGRPRQYCAVCFEAKRDLEKRADYVLARSLDKGGSCVKDCETCGNPFAVKPYRAASARFCSKSCAGVWHAKTILNDRPHTWSIGNTHRAGLRPANAFPAGHEPWNKGLAGIHLSPATEFKPGPRPDQRDPVGTVRVRWRARQNDRRAWVKVAEPNRWRLRAVVEWEKANGPLPRGLVVHHKDRDSLNDDPGNLVALTRAAHLAEHRSEIRRVLFSERAPEPKQDLLFAAGALSRGGTT